MFHAFRIVPFMKMIRVHPLHSIDLMFALSAACRRRCRKPSEVCEFDGRRSRCVCADGYEEKRGRCVRKLALLLVASRYSIFGLVIFCYSQ